MNNDDIQQKINAEQLLIHQKQDRNADRLLTLAAGLTFCFYLLFALNLYLGNPLIWHHYFETWQSATGFIFMAGVLTGLAGFLSWVKHHAYIHFGLHGSIPLVLVTVIAFALFAEVFTSSSNQDAKAQLKLTDNQAYQQTLTAPAQAPVIQDSRLAVFIAEAQQKYERCLERLNQGREPHCKGDKGKLDSLKESQQATIKQQVTLSKETMQMNFDRQDALKAEAHNPVIVSVAKGIAYLLGGYYMDYIKTAISLTMLGVAVAFEILHHFLSQSKAQTRQGVLGYELEIAKHTENKQTGEYHSADAVNQQGFGFNRAAATANSNGFKYQDKPEYKSARKRPIGFMDTNHIKPPPPAENSAQSHTQPATSTYQHELDYMGIPSPDDAALNQVADKQAIQAIIQRGLNAANRTTPGIDSRSLKPLKPDTQQVGAPSTDNRALPVKPKVGAPGLDAELLKAMQEAQQHVPVEILQEAGTVYPVWRGQVAQQQIKPSKRDGFRFISNHLCRGKKRTLTPASMIKLLSIWQLRAVVDGILKTNPNYRKGASKYLLIG